MEVIPEQMNERVRHLQDRVAPQLDEARRNLSDLNERAVGFIRANPGTCLIGAVALGFLVGKLASRR